MKLSDLKPNPSNPRKITDPKLKMLKKSLEAFGDLSGIIFNRRSGHVVGGHQRLKVIPQDTEVTMTGTDTGKFMVGQDTFSIRFVDWDEMTEKAANIAANQHGGEFDIPGLIEWVNELNMSNVDLDLLGFDQKELDGLLNMEIKVEEADIPMKQPNKCPACGHEW
jgi:hypothetical protein